MEAQQPHRFCAPHDVHLPISEASADKPQPGPSAGIQPIGRLHMKKTHFPPPYIVFFLGKGTYLGVLSTGSPNTVQLRMDLANCCSSNCFVLAPYQKKEQHLVQEINKPHKKQNKDEVHWRKTRPVRCQTRPKTAAEGGGGGFAWVCQSDPPKA